MYCQLLGWITISIPELNYTLKEEFLNNYKLNLVYDMDFSEDNEKNKNINKTTSPFFFLGGRKKSFSFIAL